jgi:hypothetical protein
MSACGTKLPIRNVRYSAAFEGTADIQQTTRPPVVTPMHAVPGDAGDLVEAGEIGLDGDLLAETLMEALSDFFDYRHDMHQTTFPHPEERAEGARLEG